MTAAPAPPAFQEIVDWRLGAGAMAMPLPLTAEAAGRVGAGGMPPDMAGLAILDSVARRFLPLNGFDTRIRFDPGAAAYVQAEDWHHPVTRYLLFAEYTLRHGLSGLFALNFFDAQPWDYAADLGQPTPLPVFQMSRLAGQAGVILWPAEAIFMGPDGTHCPASNTDRRRLEEKQPRAVWRGRLSGAFRHGRALIWAEAIKRQVLDQRHALSPYLLSNLFERFPRFGFVARYRADPACDIAFVQEHGHHHYDALIAADAALAPWRALFAGQLTPEQQLGFRFIVCLEGNDYATGLFWVLNSNSVALMAPPRWETVLHAGLLAWTHYLPLDGELDDLAEQIAWGVAHPAECAAMTARANALMRFHNDPASRAALDLAVVRRYLGAAA